MSCALKDWSHSLKCSRWVGSVDENIFFRIELKDPSGTAFGNDFLPTTPPSLGDFRGTDIGHWLLMRSLQNEEEKSIGVVYDTFSDLKEKSQPMVPKLIEMLSHSDAKHRERAAMALSNIGPLGREAVERLCELRSDLSEDMRVRACAVWALNRIDRQAEARFWKDWHVTVTPENPVARGPMRISGEFLLREQPDRKSTRLNSSHQ